MEKKVVLSTRGAKSERVLDMKALGQIRRHNKKCNDNFIAYPIMASSLAT